VQVLHEGPILIIFARKPGFDQENRGQKSVFWNGESNQVAIVVGNGK